MKKIKWILALLGILVLVGIAQAAPSGEVKVFLPIVQKPTPEIYAVYSEVVRKMDGSYDKRLFVAATDNYTSAVMQYLHIICRGGEYETYILESFVNGVSMVEYDPDLWGYCTFSYPTAVNAIMRGSSYVNNFWNWEVYPETINPSGPEINVSLIGAGTSEYTDLNSESFWGYTFNWFTGRDSVPFKVYGNVPIQNGMYLQPIRNLGTGQVDTAFILTMGGIIGFEYVFADSPVPSPTPTLQPTPTRTPPPPTPIATPLR